MSMDMDHRHWVPVSLGTEYGYTKPESVRGVSERRPASHTWTGNGGAAMMEVEEMEMGWNGMDVVTMLS